MDVNKSTEVLDTPSHNIMEKKNRPRKCFLLLSIFLCVVGISSLTATAAIILNQESKRNNAVNECSNTEEKDKKLRSLFNKIKATYNELYHDESDNEGLPAFFNFTPEMYRYRTETAKLLLKELNQLEEGIMDGTVTSSVEGRHTLELVKYFLLNTFGYPYENNYETGDWLMGPNIFCWQKSCGLMGRFSSAFDVAPKNSKDVKTVIKLMAQYGEAVRQRGKNLAYGVEVGIVPPQEACQAGLNNFKLLNFNVAKHGEEGIFLEEITKTILSPKFLQKVTNVERKKWIHTYKKSIQDSLNASILNNLGKPLNDFLRYLEDEYLTHCPPSNVSSGFASLPVPYVYTNGVPDRKKPTSGRLPGGEKFVGKQAYEILLSSFTTYNITPKEIDDLAERRLGEIYPQVVEIAKQITKEVDEQEAIKKFRSILKREEYYYTIQNGTDHPEPHLICNNAEKAKKYCPGRWRAMTNWLESARAIISRLHTKVPLAFYLTGEKKITPICPVDIRFDFNPASAYYSYSEQTMDCTSLDSLAKVNIPFFLERLGPKYEEVTVLAHESYPGHHLEVQGVRENFEFKCEKMGNWVSNRNYLAAFSEGWATYIEKHVADVDMKLYEDDVMSRYGMLKHQILAALRAKVDVGFHFMGMKRREAVALYDKYAWDTGDVIKKEITRLQSAPGQGTSYLVGEAKLSELRKKANESQGNNFDVRDFHYEILKRGPLPMSYLDYRGS